MCHILLQDPKFFRLLLRIDQDIAESTRQAGCQCGGRLHRANYPRKPRGCPPEVRAEFASRLSFCCDRCRRRTTSRSVRFLGRRVYLALVMVLVGSRHAGQHGSAHALSKAVTISLRTLQRWRAWSIAAIKLRKFRSSRRLNETFLKTFAKERDWQQACQLAKGSQSECAQVALDGFMTCKDLGQEQGEQIDVNDDRQILERDLQKTLQIYNRRREKGLTELASIGSTAPFIGLFGTVWGIMNALVTISATGQASIDVVAGPIGEALIATAIGIATAVPAVLAYNYFQRQQRVFSAELSEFAEDFMRFAILNRKRWSETC